MVNLMSGVPLQLSVRSPPWLCAIFFAIASPRPVPAGFVVKNGSNRCSNAPCVIGGPLFSTSIFIAESESCADIRIVDPGGEASIAFIIRLSSACCNPLASQLPVQSLGRVYLNLQITFCGSCLR